MDNFFKNKYFKYKKKYLKLKKKQKGGDPTEDFDTIHNSGQYTLSNGSLVENSCMWISILDYLTKVKQQPTDVTLEELRNYHLNDTKGNPLGSTDIFDSSLHGPDLTRLANDYKIYINIYQIFYREGQGQVIGDWPIQQVGNKNDTPIHIASFGMHFQLITRHHGINYNVNNIIGIEGGRKEEEKPLLIYDPTTTGYINFHEEIEQINLDISNSNYPDDLKQSRILRRRQIYDLINSENLIINGNQIKCYQRNTKDYKGRSDLIFFRADKKNNIITIRNEIVLSDNTNNQDMYYCGPNEFEALLRA
jgi:hypothetical protein